MKTLRRIDHKKVREIQDLIKKCLDAELNWDDRIFAEYKGVPNATRLEHVAANYPLYYIADTNRKRKVIDPDILRVYNQEIRTFNKSLKDLDMEVISVDHEFRDLDGKDFKMCFMQLAEGMKAKRAAERCDPIIKGIQNKKGRLEEMSNNPNLKKTHDAKMRAIRRLLDRSRKKKG